MARVFPNGTCWCGCGAETGSRSFFLQGHDKVAESAVIAVKYGGVAQFLEHHGFGPSGENARLALERWKEAGGKVR